MAVLRPGPTLAQLRRHTVARSLFAPTTLPRAIARLGIEEDCFVNDGFLPRATQALMHPRDTAQRERLCAFLGVAG